MDKPAITNLEIHPVIKKRWSPRSFQTGKPVEPEKLQRIFEAARWAPSSFNEQPWRFIVGTRGPGDRSGEPSDGSSRSGGSVDRGSKPDPTWEKIHATLAEFNQKWAHLAPVLVLTLGKKTFTKNGNPSKVYKYDLGASAAYMTFQAYSEGLVMHQMGGFDKEKAVEAFGIPADFEPVTAIAIGYQDIPERLIPEMEKSERAPRSRHALDELVFSEAFGRAFPFASK